MDALHALPVFVTYALTSMCGVMFFARSSSDAARSAVPLTGVTSPATARPFPCSIVAGPMSQRLLSFPSLLR